MSIPVVAKVGAVAWLLWEMFKGEKAEPPAVPSQPATTLPPPEPRPPAEPPPVAEEPPCAAPVLAKRWTLCDDGMSAVDGTTSQGDYDALYHPLTKNLIAVVDNTTYSNDGGSAWVAAVASYVNRKSQHLTGAGDPDALPIGINVAPTRTGMLPFFPFKMVRV